MSVKEDIYYESRDGKTTIHGVIWKPDSMVGENPKSPKLVLQIVHGMEEYAARYDEFARALNELDICVIANDHLGHGESISEQTPLGYFCKDDPTTVVVRDIHRLKKMVQEKMPEVPFFILGHSMGSFLARNYIARYGTGIKGAVIMGTGSQPGAVLGFGRFLTGFIALFKGWKHKSKMVAKIATGSYLKRIPEAGSVYDWLSVRKENVEKYEKDPLCGFGFTLNGYHSLFGFIKDCQAKKTVEKVPKKLPLLFVAGKEDPVGAYSVGVEKALQTYKKAGIENIESIIYENDRHEILNEDDRGKVTKDIADWLMKQ